MTMGEKLRQARMEAGLSQRRVCGDRITRNQLSLLEHDRVGPSLETLQYLAGQLGKPVSYFLEETAPNLLALEQARESTDPIQALRALDAYMPDGSVVDDLAALLEAAYVWPPPTGPRRRAEPPTPAAWPSGAGPPWNGALFRGRCWLRALCCGRRRLRKNRTFSPPPPSGTGHGNSSFWPGSAWLRTGRTRPWPCWRTCRTRFCSEEKPCTAWAGTPKPWSSSAGPSPRLPRPRPRSSGLCWRPAAGSAATIGALTNMPPGSGPAPIRPGKAPQRAGACGFRRIKKELRFSCIEF